MLMACLLQPLLRFLAAVPTPVLQFPCVKVDECLELKFMLNTFFPLVRQCKPFS